jgi:hypothetical protein
MTGHPFVWATALLAGFGVAPARGEFLPRFHLETCARRATHIVVLDEWGEIKESWHGDLEVGRSVPLPRFPLPRGAEWLKQYGSGWGTEPPKAATGNRVVLFLVRGDKVGGRYRAVAGWAAASFGDFAVSAAWIEGGVAYTIGQPMNPGPQRILRFGTEAELKKCVAAETAPLRKQFEAARDEKDSKKRAEALAALVWTGYGDEAIELLAGCGKPGIEKLASLATPDEEGRGPGLAAVVALTGLGPAARDTLLLKVAGEAKWWAETEWLGREIEERDELKDRRRFLHALFENPDALRALSAEQRETVRAVLGLCRKYPQLDDRGPGRPKFYRVLSQILEKQTP